MQAHSYWPEIHLGLATKRSNFVHCDDSELGIVREKAIELPFRNSSELWSCGLLSTVNIGHSLVQACTELPQFGHVGAHGKDLLRQLFV